MHLHRVFGAQAIDALRGISIGVCSDARATFVEIDGENDHVHPRPSASCDDTSSSRRPRTEHSRQLRPQRYTPPEGRGLPRVLVSRKICLALRA